MNGLNHKLEVTMADSTGCQLQYCDCPASHGQCPAQHEFVHPSSLRPSFAILLRHTMVFAVPFRSAKVLYIILLDTSSLSLCFHLSHCHHVDNVTFLHITGCKLQQLAATMSSHQAHLSFRVTHGFVEPSSRDLRAKTFHQRTHYNYLANNLAWCISLAKVQH